MANQGIRKLPLIPSSPLDSSILSGSQTSGVILSRTMSSPLISKYGKRRVKKLGNRTLLSHRLQNPYDKEKKPIEQGSSFTEDGSASRYVKDTEEYKMHLIRKIFLPKAPLDLNIRDYLPPLTSSASVDLELYCFIGLLFKNFVNEWYFQITENDEFISEVIDVVSYITRNLESRVKRVNLEGLLLDDVPYILDNHRSFYMYCLNNLDTQYVQYTNMNDAFDAMNNHPALSIRFKCLPGAKKHEDYNLSLNDDTFFTDRYQDLKTREEELQKIEQNYLYMLSKGALALLLPKEVLSSNLSRNFVRSVMSNVVLRILTKQLSEPDIIYTILLSIFRSMDKSKKDSDDEKPSKPSEDDETEIPKTFKGKIVNFFRLIGHMIAYSTSTGSTKNPRKLASRPPISNRYIFRFLNNLFSFSIENPILYIIMKYFALWFLSYNAEEIHNMKKMRNNKSILTRSKSMSSTMSSDSEKKDEASNLQRIQSSLSALVNANLFAIRINRIIYNLFEKLILQKFFRSEVFIRQLLKAARNTIFPEDDKMGPPRKIPNEQELEEMKIELFLLMKKNIPFWFQLLIFNEAGGPAANQDPELVFIDDDEQDNGIQANDVIMGDGFYISSFGLKKKDKFRSMIKTKTDFKFYRFIESFKYQKFNKLLVYHLTDRLFMELFPEMKDLCPSQLERRD